MVELHLLPLLEVLVRSNEQRVDAPDAADHSTVDVCLEAKPKGRECKILDYEVEH